uniref:non-ribosomal peptide synthetase n=1 Tax=uncultured Shewanella sp. TaxID=173975 RepID=UPI00262D8DD0
QWNYALSLFEASSIKGFAEQYQRALLAILDSEKRLAEVSLISTDERHTLLHEWNPTETNYLCDKTLSALFEEQVAKTPNNIALVFEGAELTYDELNQRANKLAHHLRSQYQEVYYTPLQPDTLIALYLDRSLEMVLSIIAVLKAGGAYVPIAPEYPQARSTFMLDDTQAPLAITQADYEVQLREWLSQAKLCCTVISVNGSNASNDNINDKSDFADNAVDNPVSINQSSDLAYVIYTSGTTGKPKGVMSMHQGVSTLVCGTDYIDIDESDVFLHHSSPQFDAATFEIWGALLNGAQLVVVNKALVLDAVALESLLSQYQVSILWLTKSLFDEILNQKSDVFSTLSYLLVGGEALNAHLINGLVSSDAKPKHVLNGYGPTESTTFTTAYACVDERETIPLGKGISTRHVYVMTAAGQLAPKGAIGELYIGGAGLARGYLNRPELTVERFIDNPFAREEDIANGDIRLYQTGDLVRYLSNGDLEYLGRNDAQVKIRGHRIELGEIETALEEIGGIKQAAVIDYQSAQSHFLAAFVVPDFAADSIHFNNDRRSMARHMTEIELSLDLKGVKQSLASVLPSFMLPTSFSVIDKIPLTMNGKLDKEALPEPILVNDEDYAPPRNEVERQLCQIWQEVLGLEQVGIHDNFFHIGGDSIKAIQLMSQMNKINDEQVSLVMLFTYPSIADLCEKRSDSGQGTSLLYTLTPMSTAKDKLVMIHPGTSGAEVYHHLALALSTRFNCFGVNNYNLVSDDKIGSLKVIALMYLDLLLEANIHHDPINILGWSLGGNIALEIAYQLELRGYTDVQIYLLDTVIHTEETQAVLDKIEDDVYLQMMQRDIIDKNASQEHTERVLSAVPFENDIHQESLTGLLNHTKVTLFKAEELMNINEQYQELTELNELINQLDDNNIQAVINSPLKIVSIEDKHHTNIIEAIEIISENIITR